MVSRGISSWKQRNYNLDSKLETRGRVWCLEIARIKRFFSRCNGFILGRREGYSIDILVMLDVWYVIMFLIWLRIYVRYDKATDAPCLTGYSKERSMDGADLTLLSEIKLILISLQKVKMIYVSCIYNT